MRVGCMMMAVLPLIERLDSPPHREFNAFHILMYSVNGFNKQVIFLSRLFLDLAGSHLLGFGLFQSERELLERVLV